MCNRWIMAVIFTLFLVSCPPSPDYISESGVGYYFNDASWNLQQIEAQEQGFLKDFKDLKSQTPNMSGLSVEVVSESFPCWAGKCNGIQDYDNLKVAVTECPFTSALTHEEAHWLQQTIYKVDDYNHADTALWQIADQSRGVCNGGIP